jgi:hypothetical protein
MSIPALRAYAIAINNRAPTRTMSPMMAAVLPLSSRELTTNDRGWP